jgi:hypothetical protein
VTLTIPALNSINHHINQCNKEINTIKEFTFNQICLVVAQLGEAFLGKNKYAEKDKLRPVFDHFNDTVPSLMVVLNGTNHMMILLSKYLPHIS